VKLHEQVKKLEEHRDAAVEELQQIAATFVVNFGPQARVPEHRILTGQERVHVMQIKVLEHLYQRAAP
jgi:hypothetical protein